MDGTEIIRYLGENLPAVLSTVNCVVGGVFTVVFLRRNTSAKEFEKIKAGQFKEVADSLLGSGNMTYTEYYKANNFLEIAKKADVYHSQMKHEETTQYDFDWFTRFYEMAGNVSDDFMQELWAKILAGEVSRPSSFSLKTIDVLRNLGRSDALLFLEICASSFQIEDAFFLPNDEKYLENKGIKYIDVMRLSELGLIYNDPLISYNFVVTKTPMLTLKNHELILLISSNDGKEVSVSIRQYPFTKAGREIASLCFTEASSDNIIEYAKLLAEKNKAYKLSVNKVVKWNMDKVEMYDKTNLIE